MTEPLQRIVRRTVLEKGLRHGVFDLRSIRNQIIGTAKRESLPIDLSIIDDLISLEIQTFLSSCSEASRSTEPSIEQIRAHAREIFEQLYGSYEPYLAPRSNPLMLSLNKDCPSVIRTRFAPNPSGPLHIGHSRVLCLNDEICDLNNGTMILRFEDTNPEKIEAGFYQMILDDVRWLIGFDRIEQIVYQSDRLDRYHTIAHDLIERTHAFVCRCDQIRSERRALQLPCDCRLLPVEAHLEAFKQMLALQTAPRELAVVLKTDLNDSNPSLRDLVILRTKDAVHPRLQQLRAVYPTLNFAVAVDDIEMGVTVIVRGKDHIINEHKQAYVMRYLSTEFRPIYLHTGLVRTRQKLKTTLIKEAIAAGALSGWDAPETDTLGSLRRRQLSPTALRAYWIETGMTQGEIRFDYPRFYRLDARATPELQTLSLDPKGLPLQLLQPDGSLVQTKIVRTELRIGQKYRVPGYGSIVIEKLEPPEGIVSNPII